MHIKGIERKIIGKKLEISACISGLPNHGPDARLWFRFSNGKPDGPGPDFGFAESLTDRAEPFVTALLPTAMTVGQSIRVDGTVSERLLCGCAQVMDIFTKWYRRLHVVSIEPDTVTSERFDSQGVLCFFTGGVDSFYTVLKNLDETVPPERISSLLFIHGIDIPLENVTLFDSVREDLAEVVRSLGTDLIVCETNIRHLTDRYVRWRIQTGAGLASIALCLSPAFRKVLIASSDIYSSLVPWGTHPLVDPLWSTESTTFIHDGCEASRAEKVRRNIGKSDIALRHLRVCYKNTESRTNCGKCEKCVRTMINLRIAGVLDRCTNFESPLDLRLLQSTLLENPVGIEYIPDNLKALAISGGDPELETALRTVMKRLPVRMARTFLLVDRFDERYLGGAARKVCRTIKRMLRRNKRVKKTKPGAEFVRKKQKIERGVRDANI